MNTPKITTTVRRYLAHLGRVGGHKTSAAKTLAARRNSLLGAAARRRQAEAKRRGETT
jgi:hypothetical protein